MCVNNEDVHSILENFLMLSTIWAHISLDKKIVSYDYEDQLNISITFALSQEKRRVNYIV